MTSLQQQLLKAGVADKKKLKKVAAEKRRESAELRNQQQATGKKKKKRAAVVTPAQAAAAKAQADKAAKDRALNEQKNAAAAAKALRAQIIQLVAVNEVKRSDKSADKAYRFTHNDHKTVETIYVTELQKDQLSRGVLAIVQLGETYSLVPANVADKIKTRDASVIASQHTIDKTMVSSTEESIDDPYADYQIPDDFDW